MPEARACREAVAGLLASAELLLAKRGTALPAGQLEATRLRDANQARRAHASVTSNPSPCSLISETSVVRLACAACAAVPRVSKSVAGLQRWVALLSAAYRAMQRAETYFLQYTMSCINK